LSHSKQRGDVVGGYTYRPAARIVWPVPRPLASSVVLGHYLTDVVEGFARRGTRRYRPLISACVFPRSQRCVVADIVRQECDRLDILINNAGICGRVFN